MCQAPKSSTLCSLRLYSALPGFVSARLLHLVGTNPTAASCNAHFVCATKLRGALGLLFVPRNLCKGIRHATNRRDSAKPCRVLSSVCAALSLREECFASLRSAVVFASRVRRKQLKKQQNSTKRVEKNAKLNQLSTATNTRIYLSFAVSVWERVCVSAAAFV